MKDRKTAILTTAIQLFATDGFKATTTKKIADVAKVSEGLIFKHFANKEGLLEAILSLGNENLQELFLDLLASENPSVCLQAFFALVRKVKNDPDIANFWRLLYKIKWETERYNVEELKPIHEKLTWTFQALGYENPQGEATLLMIWMDGLATQFYLNPQAEVEASIAFLEKKYTNQ